MMVSSGRSVRAHASRQLAYEVASGASGLALVLFMWGHLLLVGSILTGERGFDWLATTLEEYFIAQPTVLLVLVLFFVHALFASRKIPAQLDERRRLASLARDLRESGRHAGFRPHVESQLWLWQVRTGIVILIIGSFHIILLGVDVLTPVFGARTGIEAATSGGRVQAGLWLPYAILLVCVEFHAGVGLYRLAIKWGGGRLVSRRALGIMERIVLWGFLGLGGIILLVLSGVLPPPLAFLLEHAKA